MRQLTSDELKAMFVAEKLLPLEKAFPVFDADDPLQDALRIEALKPVKRRQFLCEKVEESYRQLLAAAKDGPQQEQARATLALAIDQNLRWVRNNIAASPPGILEELPFLVRIEELSLEYRRALDSLLDALSGSSPPVTLDAVAAKVDALHAKADTIRDDTHELAASVPATITRQAQEIYLYADALTVTPTGDLLAQGGYRKEYDQAPAIPITLLALAAGKWTAFYAAALLDGAAAAVQHWAGEVER